MKWFTYTLASVGGWFVVSYVAVGLLLRRADDNALRALAEIDVPEPNRDWADELLRRCQEAGKP